MGTASPGWPNGEFCHDWTFRRFLFTSLVRMTMWWIKQQCSTVFFPDDRCQPLFPDFNLLCVFVFFLQDVWCTYQVNHFCRVSDMDESLTATPWWTNMAMEHTLAQSKNDLQVGNCPWLPWIFTKGQTYRLWSLNPVPFLNIMFALDFFPDIQLYCPNLSFVFVNPNVGW